jgi:hypothetical protein
MLELPCHNYTVPIELLLHRLRHLIFHGVVQILGFQLAQRVARRFEVIRQLLGYCFANLTLFSVTTTNCSSRLSAWEFNKRFNTSIFDLARSSSKRNKMMP